MYVMYGVPKLVIPTMVTEIFYLQWRDLWICRAARAGWLNECLVSKTALFNIKCQDNWVHKKGLVLLFHMGYNSLLPAKNGKVAIRNVEGCWVRLALLRKTAVGK